MEAAHDAPQMDGTAATPQKSRLMTRLWALKCASMLQVDAGSTIMGLVQPVVSMTLSFRLAGTLAQVQENRRM